MRAPSLQPLTITIMSVVNRPNAVMDSYVLRGPFPNRRESGLAEKFMTKRAMGTWSTCWPTVFYLLREFWSCHRFRSPVFRQTLLKRTHRQLKHWLKRSFLAWAHTNSLLTSFISFMLHMLSSCLPKHCGQSHKLMQMAFTSMPSYYVFRQISQYRCLFRGKQKK